jgi:hypothetical protein
MTLLTIVAKFVLLVTVILVVLPPVMVDFGLSGLPPWSVVVGHYFRVLLFYQTSPASRNLEQWRT